MTRHGGGRGGHQPNRPRLYLTVTVVLRRCSTSSPMHCIFTLKKKRAHTLRFRLPQSYAMPETIALRASAGQQDSDLPPSRRGVCHVALGQGGKKKQKSELALGLFNNSQRQENLEIPKKNILRLGGRFGHLRQLRNRLVLSTGNLPASPVGSFSLAFGFPLFWARCGVGSWILE